MKRLLVTTAFLLGANSAFAEGHSATQGDAAAGETQFQRQCVACHVVRDPDGNVIAGRTARTGPNLYGLAGNAPGSVEGYRYGDALVKLGENGTIWTEDAFVGYVQHPTNWLRETLGDGRARGKMAYRVRDVSDAYDIYAFIASVGEE